MPKEFTDQYLLGGPQPKYSDCRLKARFLPGGSTLPGAAFAGHAPSIRDRPAAAGP